MAIVVDALAPNTQYTIENFIKAVRTDPTKFRTGALIKILTQDQRINKGPKEQKVNFIFRSWVIRCTQTARDVSGLSGFRIDGDLIENLRDPQRRSKLSCCCGFLPDFYLHQGDMMAKEITYISKDEDMLGSFLTHIPIDLIKLIWAYVQRQ